MGAVARVGGQVPPVEVAHKLLDLEAELLVEKDGGVGGRDVKGEILAQVGLYEVVEDDSSQAVASPGRVDREVGEVGLAPPGVRHHAAEADTQPPVEIYIIKLATA